MVYFEPAPRLLVLLFASSDGYAPVDRPERHPGESAETDLRCRTPGGQKEAALLDSIDRQFDRSVAYRRRSLMSMSVALPPILASESEATR